MYQSLDKRIWFIIIFLSLKESLNLFQIWNFFVKLSYFNPIGVIERRIYKVNKSILMENLTMPFVLVYQFYCYTPQAIGLVYLKSLSLELEAFSCSFKITCIPLKQILSPKEMVMSPAKFTNLISWFPISIPLILLLALMEMVSASPAITYNSNESGPVDIPGEPHA